MSAVAQLYDRLYATICGRPPEANLFHFQGLLYHYLRRRIQSLTPFAKGVFVDVGCGARPYEKYFRSKVERYVALDFPQTQRQVGGARAPHAYADALNLPLKSGSADTLFYSEVLEHLPDPRQAFSEIARVLSPSGHLLLTTPFLYHLHSEPHDFSRQTPHGLRRLAVEAGLEIVAIRSLGGFWGALTINLNDYVYLRLLNANFLTKAFKATLGLILLPLWFGMTSAMALVLDSVLPAPEYAFNYTLVARRPK
ncbi:MAG: class I SAM-dependent methyltransferase [bacterium]